MKKLHYNTTLLAVALIFLLSACTGRVTVTSQQVLEAEKLCDNNSGVKKVTYAESPGELFVQHADVVCNNGARFKHIYKYKK